MSIRFQNYLFFRFAILALLAGFSSFVSATEICTPWTIDTPCDGENETLVDHWDDWVQDSPTVRHRRCNAYSKSNGDFAFSFGTQTCTTVVNTDPCDNGAARDPVTDECTVVPNCPAGTTAFTTTSSGGAIAHTSCVPIVQPPPTGPCITYNDMQSAGCQKAAADCTSTGGTFGNINGSNVCVPPGNAGNPPVCASGGTQMQTNADGSSSPVCIGSPNIAGDGTPAGNDQPKRDANTPEAQSAADTANNTAQIAKINNAGFQAIVNAINNGTAATKATVGGGGGNNNVDMSGVVSAINANTASEHGAGTCDPHAANYAQCIGEVEQAADISSDKQNAIDVGNDQLQSAADGITHSIEQRPDVEDGTAGIIATIKSYLPDASGCNDISLNFPHTTVVIDCNDTALMRAWMAWGLAISTILACFYVAFGRTV